MRGADAKGRPWRRAGGRMPAAVTALAAALALWLVGGCSRLFSIVDPSAF